MKSLCKIKCDTARQLNLNQHDQAQNCCYEMIEHVHDVGKLQNFKSRKLVIC